MNKETDLAWLAGFFDGEGSISICRPQGKSTPQFMLNGNVNITNTNGELLKHCLQIVAEERLLPGHIGRTNVAICLRWSSTQGTHLLALLRPYLFHPKQKERAEIYCKIFDPEKKGLHRPEERKELWENWKLLQQLEKEQRRTSTFQKTVKGGD